MAKKVALPKSKAKTAYGLLSEIATLAVDEPKRINMGDWYVTRASCSDYYEPRRGWPSCGTIGCIGGWTEVLRRGPDATVTLGLSEEQSEELFYPKRILHSPGQTVTHARATAAHIRRFQKKYAKQLKAKRLA